MMNLEDQIKRLLWLVFIIGLLIMGQFAYAYTVNTNTQNNLESFRNDLESLEYAVLEVQAVLKDYVNEKIDEVNDQLLGMEGSLYEMEEWIDDLYYKIKRRS